MWNNWRYLWDSPFLVYTRLELLILGQNGVGRDDTMRSRCTMFIWSMEHNTFFSLASLLFVTLYIVMHRITLNTFVKFNIHIRWGVGVPPTAGCPILQTKTVKVKKQITLHGVQIWLLRKSIWVINNIELILDTRSILSLPLFSQAYTELVMKYPYWIQNGSTHGDDSHERIVPIVVRMDDGMLHEGRTQRWVKR